MIARWGCFSPCRGERPLPPSFLGLLGDVSHPIPCFPNQTQVGFFSKLSVRMLPCKDVSSPVPCTLYPTPPPHQSGFFRIYSISDCVCDL